MLAILNNIPNINENPLVYIFEKNKFKHKSNTLWVEFGVFTGGTINYISRFTNDIVFGFDSFEGLPEKWRDNYNTGHFSLNGILPQVNSNVHLIKGWFQDTLQNFLISINNKKISFIHIDCDIYTSTKFILSSLHNYIDNECIIVFDELVNYDGFDNNNGELRAFYEYITEYNVNFEYIGMNGTLGMKGGNHQKVAIKIIK